MATRTMSGLFFFFSSLLNIPCRFETPDFTLQRQPRKSQNLDLDSRIQAPTFTIHLSYSGFQSSHGRREDC